jgi:prolyl oligopeptidase
MLTETSIPDPVCEVIHGVTVVDPYRWLEDRGSPLTSEWIEDQKRIHDAYFAKLPPLGALRDRVGDSLNLEKIDQPSQVGSRCFFRRRQRGQEQASICIFDTETGEERALVDPSQLGPFAAVTIQRISDDGSLMAYALKVGGADMQAIHVVDVNSGRTFPDTIPQGYARGFTFTAGNAGFYYCHDFDAKRASTTPHQIKIHTFGEDVDRDRVVFSLPRTRRSRLVLIADEIHLGAAYVYDRGPEMETDFYLASRTENLHWETIVSGKPVPYCPFLRNGHIYIISYAETPNGQLLQLNDTDRIQGRVIVPEWSVMIRSLSIVEDRVYVSYMIDLETVVRCWSLTGELIGPIDTLKGGSFDLLPSAATYSSALLGSYESFSQRPAIFSYNPSTGTYLPWPRQQGICDTDPRRVEKISYQSKDGTAIPLTLVMSGKGDSTAQRPVILTAYGGFGACMTPRFSALVNIMLDLGAVFALPNIRGGSEFGKHWHDAATRQNRQVAYDDFIATAEWLCSNGITNPEKLAIFGGSNSGLLVGVAMTQRPDLFRAIMCIAPILDMVRYEQFGDANKWQEEYGTVDDPEDFRVLHGYSPYHRVQEHVDYPATLFVAGDKDDRCDPAHVRKMAASLQDRPAQERPVLVDYSAERGHSPVLPLSVRVDALTRRIAFLCTELGIELPPEDYHEPPTRS